MAPITFCCPRPAILHFILIFILLTRPVIFASCDAGVANYNIKTGEWNLIPPGGWGRAGYLTLADAPASSSPKVRVTSALFRATAVSHVGCATATRLHNVPVYFA